MDDRMFLMAELLGTRLCHDLTGPIGAVNNGAEFLEDDPSMLEDALELITSSASQAVHRLQFYRQAYGRINPQGESNIFEKRDVASLFLSDTKVKLDWRDLPDELAHLSINQRIGKMLLNMIIVAQSTVLRDGTITVEVGGTVDAPRFTMKSEGPLIKLSEDTAQILSGNREVTLDPKTVQIYLMCHLAEMESCKISTDVAENHFILTVQK